MEMPNVSNIFRNTKRNITIDVLAYRKLSNAELLEAIRYFRSTKEGRRLKNNGIYQIVSTIGAND